MIAPSTTTPCPLVAKELAMIEADYTRRKTAVLSAAGLIAEAEALAEEISPLAPLALFSPLVHNNHRDKATVYLYVWAGHLAFFEALATLGIGTRELSEITFDEFGKSRRTLAIDGFDVTILAESEIVREH